MKVGLASARQSESTSKRHEHLRSHGVVGVFRVIALSVNRKLDKIRGQ